MPWLPVVVAVEAWAGGEPDVQASVVGQHAIQDEPSVLLDGVTVMARRGAARERPDRLFDQAEIDGFGAADIGEVVGRINEASGSASPPIVIVNGRRVSDPGVFMALPADALARVELLPPPAFANYGGANPAARVINIVLEPKFLGRDVEVGVAGPTAGGPLTQAIELRRSQIAGMDTDQVNLGVKHEPTIRADRRPGYLSLHPDAGPTSLRPTSDSVNLGVTLTRQLGQWQSSFDAKLGDQATRFVAKARDDFVASKTSARSLRLAVGLSGQLGDWTVRTLTMVQGLRTETSGLNQLRSRSGTASASIWANRRLATLPAGPVSLDVTARASRSDTAQKLGLATPDIRGRNDELGVQISIPVWRGTSPEAGASSGSAGTLALSLGSNIRAIDDGHGHGLTSGFSWTPGGPISLSGAWSRSVDAPANEQRFAPALYASSVVVFDFRSEKSVELSPLVGGNPDLIAPRRETRSLGLSIGPVTRWRLSASSNYLQSAVEHEISVFPEPTLDVEAAFPERFQRDAEGDLVGLDRRPINISSSVTRVLISNFSAHMPWSSGAEGSGGLQLFLGHTWRLDDRKVLRAGLAPLQRLAGDGGGLPRHELTLRLDGRQGPWTLNLGGTWQEKYRTRREAGVDRSDDLTIGALAVFNVKLGYSLQRSRRPEDPDGSQRPPRRRAGATFCLEALNLLDTRPSARLGDGRRAPGYARDERDPVGRVVRLGITGRF